MKKTTILAALLALVALTGEANIKDKQTSGEHWLGSFRLYQNVVS